MVHIKQLEFHWEIGKHYKLQKEKLEFLGDRGMHFPQFPLGSWKSEGKQKQKFSSGDFDKWVLI